MALDVESLVRDHARPVYGYLWRLTGDPQAAEDILQEAFLKAVRAASSGRRVDQPRAWLYAVATNTARSYGRANSRRQSREQSLDPDLVDHGPSVPETAEARERLRAVRMAMGRLPHKQKAALLLRKYQGMGYGEIAAALKCSPEAARANVYQALRRLRLWLGVEEGA
jgi:RNA polymerase sigma-70 factor (ECF subfamily)